MFDDFLRQFAVFWATIDPISTLGLFLGVTGAKTVAQKRSIALRATLYAAIILIAFVLVGQMVLTYMEVRLPSFQIAGGILLFLFGVQMLFGTTEHIDEQKPEAGHDVAVFPLALPSMASPGAILAAVMLTENSTHSAFEQAFTMGVLILVLLICLALMLAAGKAYRLLGHTGSTVLVKVMGILLAALAVEAVVEGLANLGIIKLS